METIENLQPRVDELRWPELTRELDENGCALTGPLLGDDECSELAALWDDEARFRTTVDMSRYRYGHGTYKYFGPPVPDAVAHLRSAFYQQLLGVARSWAERLGDPAPWPDDFDDWLDMCHAAGQIDPTPLMLRYTAGDWNALHRDLYGDLVFPLQVVIGLDRAGVDYTGGEFLLVEQRPRAQSRGTVTVLERGHALIFTTRDRPIRSARGWSRAPVRHGVSTVRSGLRRTLGLVLHDAA
ncbi:2OG-Fe(II) oxygenase [Rhodococcus rhodochrous]|uniref:2OG-Fe(II) oxygenase n=1 Tax=Rhodococcus rhodochrous TaxID=1829 RepID=UPI001E4352D5|nr:2OG-Fe(II) oxygenase [Rhodococcus rhodochrous]MCD2098155.1 2OG-Fe(II) oxygenase [Rhodococcus rhodochrous]MCD2122281.1 2OG-Fe(II) oxygenase [Rhodococcus rhodochrous]MCQ4133778.1 2OG-Fe(II) oxygenase [Rhodococcus rhodochrous]MDJ0019145.1 2OG-Fe(II) oxygenase [Rhodococcus rhodochrous]